MQGRGGEGWQGRGLEELALRTDRVEGPESKGEFDEISWWRAVPGANWVWCGRRWLAKGRSGTQGPKGLPRRAG